MIEGVTQNIAWYFFLAGAGSGAFMLHALISTFAPHIPPRLTAASPITSPIISPLASICLVLAGSFFLLADLGVPELFYLAVLNLKHSVISFGILAIALFVSFAAAYVLAIARRKTRTGALLAPAFKWLAFAAALATASYTGYYLFSMESVDLWTSPFVIPLFLASSLSTGAAALMMTTALEHPARRRDHIKRLCRTDSALIVAETLALAAFVASRFLAGGDALALLLEMLVGSHALLFWVGVVGAGLVAPLVCERLLLKGVGDDALAIITAACVLAGGLALRCSIILV